MPTIRSVWVVSVLLACANCLARAENSASPAGVVIRDPVVLTEKVAIPASPFSGISIEVFSISTSASGSGRVTLAHQCNVPFFGSANCVEWEGQFDVQGVSDQSVGVRIVKRSTSKDTLTFEWGGEFYPVTLSSAYTSSNALVLALFGRARLNGPLNDRWGLIPYLGLSLGGPMGSSVTVNYPSMPRMTSASARGSAGGLLIGVSKRVTPTWSLFLEGRTTRFSNFFPQLSGQSSVIYGDSGEINLIARQVLIGVSSDL
jgi:hypothetical protein